MALVRGEETGDHRSVPYGRKDQEYVVDLCDGILGERALREHRFDWLLGDPNRRGVRARLPVDALYPQHRLVIEYWESQHDISSAFFDKRDRLTVSGVHRGEQRARYDRRRRDEVPRPGLTLVIIRARLVSDEHVVLVRRPIDPGIPLRHLHPPLIGTPSQRPDLEVPLRVLIDKALTVRGYVLLPLAAPHHRRDGLVFGRPSTKGQAIVALSRRRSRQPQLVL
jgi:hypothetical protein